MKILVLIAFEIAVALTATWQTFSAIGGFVYSTETARVSVLIAVCFAVVSLGGFGLAQVFHRVTIAAIAFHLSSLTASISVSVLAVFMSIFYFSRPGSATFLSGMIVAVIGLLAFAIAGMNGWQSLGQIRAWLRVTQA